MLLGVLSQSADVCNRHHFKIIPFINHISGILSKNSIFIDFFRFFWMIVASNDAAPGGSILPFKSIGYHQGDGPMYGLEAIREAGGWQMAALGVIIVFTSLILLSLVISQLHVFLEFWEKRGLRGPDGPPPPATQTTPPVQTLLPHPPISPDDAEGLAAVWSPLVEQLNDPFTLADLYRGAEHNKFPHPHLTINRLRQAGFLIPIGDGRFSWKQA
jgi:hypothetical protein